MDKLILKRIAKDWCKGILLSCDSTSFMDFEDEGVLSKDEIDFILKETFKIADRITIRESEASLESIIGKYYE